MYRFVLLRFALFSCLVSFFSPLFDFHLIFSLSLLLRSLTVLFFLSFSFLFCSISILIQSHPLPPAFSALFFSLIYFPLLASHKILSCNCSSSPFPSISLSHLPSPLLSFPNLAFLSPPFLLYPILSFVLLIFTRHLFSYCYCSSPLLLPSVLLRFCFDLVCISCFVSFLSLLFHFTTFFYLFLSLRSLPVPSFQFLIFSLMYRFLFLLFLFCSVSVPIQSCLMPPASSALSLWLLSFYSFFLLLRLTSFFLLILILFYSFSFYSNVYAFISVPFLCLRCRFRHLLV